MDASCSTPDGYDMHGFPDNPLNHNELPLHVWLKWEREGETERENNYNNNNNSTTDPVMDRSSASAYCQQQFMPCLRLVQKSEKKSEMACAPSAVDVEHDSHKSLARNIMEMRTFEVLGLREPEQSDVFD